MRTHKAHALPPLLRCAGCNIFRTGEKLPKRNAEGFGHSLQCFQTWRGLVIYNITCRYSRNADSFRQFLCSLAACF